MNTPRKHSKHPNDLKRIVLAFYYSACGFHAAFKEEAAFRMEVYASSIIIPMALLLGDTATQRAILIGSWFLVLITEIVNSAIEGIVDRISLEIHPESKKIKDMGSAAVFLSLINVLVVWGIVLISS